MSKIFKKNKKSNSTKKDANGKRIKSWNADGTAVDHSLPTTPDSMDSEYEDSLPAGVTTTASGATVVQFQTQTRASSYRSRTNAAAAAAAQHASARKRKILKIGSKRRKCLLPRKLNDDILKNWNDNNVEFFDECEWQERKSCCGMVYECESLAGALLIDLAHYKPCAEHDKKANNNATAATLILNAQRNIKATMPATLQIAASNSNTPVLKKHHLFYKRQSESFPHGDVNTTIIKTETANSNSIHPNNNNNNSTNNISASLIPANISVTSSSQAQNLVTRQSSTKLPSSSVSPPLIVPTNQNKSHNFLHKIKADTTKIVKHSMDKLNTAVRIKPSDLQDMKQVIKTVDKSYVLASSNSSKPINNIPLSQHYAQPLSAAVLSGTSPTSSASSSSATKFSDNSSDSGFDENTLDRKSASPLQEDTERKLQTRPGVQTMFLSSGVQIQGQQQNLVLTGNEVAAKLLQNRKQMSSTMTSPNGSSSGISQMYAQNTVS